VCPVQILSRTMNKKHSAIKFMLNTFVCLTMRIKKQMNCTVISALDDQLYALVTFVPGSEP
jgi:tyrosine-protein phosphatase YwqE